MKKNTMLLFGGTGLIGTRIPELLSEKYNITSPTRLEVNLLNKNAVLNSLKSREYNVIVYAAGVTRQDIAEKERDLADKLNSIAVGWIAKTAKFTRTPVVYFSTDAVFRGDKKESPYTENDRVEPINYYGITKAQGENLVLSASNINLVLRLSSVFTADFKRKVDFARKILEKLSNGKRCAGIIDQILTPTFSDDAVFGLSRAIEKKVQGVIHLSSTDTISNYNFAKLVAGKFNYDKNLVIPCKLEEFFKDGVKRSKYGWFDTTKAQKILGKDILHSNTHNINDFYLQQNLK